MKKITYKCDFCGCETTRDVAVGNLEEKILFDLDGEEACSKCVEEMKDIAKLDVHLETGGIKLNIL